MIITVFTGIPEYTTCDGGCSGIFPFCLFNDSIKINSETLKQIRFQIFELSNNSMVVRLSTVFLANLETLFVTIRSILPARASSIMVWNPMRFLMPVLLIPSSVYTETNSQSSRLLM